MLRSSCGKRDSKITDDRDAGKGKLRRDERLASIFKELCSGEDQENTHETRSSTGTFGCPRKPKARVREEQITYPACSLLLGENLEASLCTWEATSPRGPGAVLPWRRRRKGQASSAPRPRSISAFFTETEKRVHSLFGRWAPSTSP